MTSFRHLPLNKKLLSVIMITTSSALVLACVVIVLYDLLLYRESITRELSTQADIIGATSISALANNHAEGARITLNALRFQPSITKAAIYTKDGEIFATFGLQADEPVQSVTPSEYFSWTELMSYSLVREIIHDGERIGTIYIQASFVSLFDRWTGFLGIVLGVLFASGLFGLVLSARLQKVISEPILRLTSLAKRISSEKNYSLREAITTHDEIGTLIQGINNMLEQIQLRDRQLERHKQELEEVVEKRTAELAQLHQQVQLILETAGEGIYGLDTQGCVTFLNPAAARMLGYVPQDVVGQHMHNLLQFANPSGSPHSTEESPIYLSYTKGHEARVADEVLWRQDGTCFPVEYTTSPMRNRDGTLVGAVVTFRDITERRQTELAKEEAKQAAEMASQAKSRFLANMSHEIRTPMSGVLGMTELLLNSSLSSRQKHYAETVLRSARNLLQIINDILDFSKMEAKKLTIDHINFPLHQTIEDAVEVFADKAQGKHLELVSIIDTHLPEHAVGDPNRLTQVMTNLIGNALKFTSRGEVIIRATLESQFTEQFHVRLEVQDSGIGIAPEAQEKIFSAFSQADDSTTREYGGTGLGLAISKELVELMGGGLGVSSDGHTGSSFFFTIPLRPASQTQELNAWAPLSTSASTLLVEDHEPTRTMIADWLTQWGMSVCHAGTGEEAVHMLRESLESHQAFDCVIIDHTLPDLPGVELIKKMGMSGTSPSPFCLFLSPWHMTDTESRMANALGLAGIVYKPLRRTALYAALSRALNFDPHGEMNNGATSIPYREGTNNRRILLAEDHHVNQEIVRAMADHLQFHLDIVGDGHQAIAMLHRQSYDLVLMDWQMPELDGLSACAQIRQQQICSRRQTHLPIIAFTALNSTDDRKQCIDAGLDDVLPKPFNLDQFTSMLVKWAPLAFSEKSPVPGSVLQDESTVKVTSPDDTLPDGILDYSVLDRIRALQRPGGPDIVTKVIQTYLNNSSKLLTELREGTAQQDAARIRRAAHTLKSSSTSVGALRLGNLCLELEEQAKAENLTQTDSFINLINAEYEMIRPALSTLSTEGVHG